MINQQQIDHFRTFGFVLLTRVPEPRANAGPAGRGRQSYPRRLHVNVRRTGHGRHQRPLPAHGIPANPHERLF